MAEYRDTIRVVSTIGLGLGSGMMLATSSLFLPILKQRSLTHSDKLNIWASLFHNGATQLPVLFVGSGVLSAVSAYLASAAPQGGSGFVAENRQSILAAASLLALFSAPWTRFVMWDNIQRLLTFQELAGSSAGVDKSPLVANDVDAQIHKWDMQHRVRIVTLSAAFIFSALELAA
ncbi:hypothetical protein BKA62DRAFT_691023 [Auriculariales sp. MPI-PUGE-AT-0066]|nr:hypothetical protein BKA62DRAFT_691023 [Auriculariales sp. MPI-PUGE-AT-0066]